MTDTWGMAAVTRSFAKLLERIALDDPGFSPMDVLTRAPDRILRDDQNLNRRKLNLFLYQLRPNNALANADAPYRNGSGDLVTQPTLAVDLHYLLTAYGRNHDELDAQHLLAHAMSVVHDNGQLGRDHVRAAITGTPMASTNLADQVEAITLSPESLSDEELFRMWTAFEGPYRISVGYRASVLLITRPKPARKAPPVREAGVTAAPVQRPIVEAMDPHPVTAGASVVLRGLNLRADEVIVRFPTGDVAPTAVSETELTVSLPADLPVGPNSLQVLNRKQLSNLPETRPFAASDPFAFVLIPKITGTLPATAPRGGVMSLTVQPKVEREQRVTAILGQTAIERQAPTTAAPSTNTVRFAIPSDLQAGSRLLRVDVNGTESALTVDAAGNYTGPRVNVT